MNGKEARPIEELRLLSCSRVAFLLGRSQQQVRTMVRQGRLAASREGKRLYFTEMEIRAYIVSRPAATYRTYKPKENA